MMTSDFEWYVLRNGQQVGPMRFDQLQELAKQRIFLPTDLYWRNGLENWIAADEMPAHF